MFNKRKAVLIEAAFFVWETEKVMVQPAAVVRVFMNYFLILISVCAHTKSGKVVSAIFLNINFKTLFHFSLTTNGTGCLL